MEPPARRSLSSDDSEARTYTTEHGSTATTQTANVGASSEAAPLSSEGTSIMEGPFGGTEVRHSLFTGRCLVKRV